MNAETTPGQEEEYHFGEPETSPTDYTAAAATPVKTKSSFANNKFLLFLILATVIFSIYKLLDILIFSRSSTPPTTTITKTSTITPVPTPAPTPAAPPEPTPAPVALPQPAAPTIPAQIEDRFHNVEQQASNNQAAIDKLTTQVTDMQTTLNTLTDRLSALSTTIETINTRLEAQAAAEAAAKARLLVRRVHRVPAPVYFVKAMVQGRAWLITGSGHIITVRVGDDLPGYGTVRSIDHSQGIITLSSGAIIGYSPGDS